MYEKRIKKLQAEKEGQKGIQESCENQKTKKSTHKRSPKAKKVKKKKTTEREVCV